MKFNSYEHTVIAPTSSMSQHFQLEQPSVIKTAPPGARHTIHFSPKHEPIDIAPLHDLGKMHSNMDYYMPLNGGYSTRTYDYLNSTYPEIQSSIPTVFQTAINNISNSSNLNNTSNNQQQHDWRSADSYIYSNSSRNTSSSSSGIHYMTQQQIHEHEALTLQHQESLALSQQHEERLYKVNELLSSPNSTLPLDPSLVSVANIALLDEAAAAAAVSKHDFFLSSNGATSSSGAVVSYQSQLSQLQYASVITSHSHQQIASTSAVDLLNSTTGLIAAAAAAAAASTSTQHFDNNHHRREHSIGSISCSNRDVSPVVIMKLENSLGFQYILEAPISTSIRREDDRMTYVNKGQFYTILLDYIPDPCKPLKGNTVRSVVMVVFREDKSYEDEIKTWQLWHKRQHTTKQRIIEVDTKNSSGIIGLIEEVSHNAIQFCWNPNEPLGAKVSIAVQCLSTDFSTQKGVKGLPLHVQIDTYDEGDENNKIPFHRGYCQIKVFCDKGAERKLRDEDKRANKRKNATGGGAGISSRKKSDGEFHEMCDRSEFYHMSDLEKPAALFIPTDDFDTRFLDSTSIASFDALSELEPLPKRPRTLERIMIYVREEDDEIFTPLHLTPPNLLGLSHAICEKYNLDETKIVGIYKRCCPSGSLGCDPAKTNSSNRSVTVKIDDDMVRHYTNQDTFFIEIKPCSDDASYCSITLVELISNNNNNNNCENCQSPLTPPTITNQIQHQHQSLYSQNHIHHHHQQLNQLNHINSHHAHLHLNQHHHQLIQGGPHS